MRTIPYGRIRAAEQTVRTAFPDATAVKGLWTPNGAVEVIVEVWHGSRAVMVRP